MQGGISEYGDARSLNLGAAGGENLAGGHLIWSVEYRDRAALPDAATRPLGKLGTSSVGAGTTASPYTLVTNIRQSNTAPGGLIVSGPGRGLQFLSDGSLAPFNPGTPTATTNFSIGGDGGIEHNEYLLPVFTTGQAFAYYSHPIGNAELYLQARYALARSYEAGQIFTNINGSGLSTNGSTAQYPITIYSGIAFLTPAAQAALFPAGGPTSFQMNRMDNDLMSRLSLDQHTGALAIGAGLNGTLGDDRTWDFAYTHGETRTQLTTRNNVNTARFYAALDAVRDPATGSTVCNVTLTAPGAFPGCVPLNLFGQSATVVNGSNASQAALDYVAGNTWWVAHNGLDDFSANVSGTLWQGWSRRPWGWSTGWQASMSPRPRPTTVSIHSICAWRRRGRSPRRRPRRWAHSRPPTWRISRRCSPARRARRMFPRPILKWMCRWCAMCRALTCSPSSVGC